MQTKKLNPFSDIYINVINPLRQCLNLFKRLFCAMPARMSRQKFTKKTYVVTFINTVAKSVLRWILLHVLAVEREKYQKMIAPMEIMGTVCNTLVAIHSITAAKDV